MIHVSLSKARIEQCREWAAQRSSNRRATTKKLSEDYDFIGVLAEESFGILIGQPGPRFDPSFRDAGYDFKTALGTVNVKGSGPNVEHLYVTAGTSLKADFYCLVYVRGLDARPYANVFGFAFKAEVAKREARVFKANSNPAHRLEPDALNDASRLVAEIRRRGAAKTRDV